MRKTLALALSVSLCLVLGGMLAQAYNEAPILAELVKAGKLPPVEERLPAEPQVVEPLEEIGQYGGDWHRAWLGPGADGASVDRINTDPIVYWDRSGTKVVPNIAKSWEMSEGGKVLTLHLRKGIKWSDGAPFTADDILFWYKDIILNDELTPSKPKWLWVGKELGKIEKVGDYVVRLRFNEGFMMPPS